jgi:DNA gyrase subunit B
MPELVERGHIYIAQPPLYKVKLGKEEQYLKDGTELDAYLLKVALKDAKLDTGVPGAALLQGDALEALARQYVLAKNVVERLSSWMDVEALRAMANGLALDIDTLEAAEQSAAALKAALHDAEVTAEFDARTEKHILRISRMHHGNVKSSVVTADFVHGADYEALSTAGQTFRGLVGEAAIVKRGEGEKQKEMRVGDFREAMAWLIQQAEGAVARAALQRIGRDEPVAAVGNDHGPGRAALAARSDR